MKIKKTLALITTAVLSLSTFVGCSEATKNYSKELSNMAKWESQSATANGNITVTNQGQKLNMKFDMNVVGNANKSMAEMSFGEVMGFKIPDIKAYVDNDKVYINKSYFEGIYKMVSEPVPEKLANLDAEYIGIEMTQLKGMDIQKMKDMQKDPEYLIKLGKYLFGEADLDLPVKQNGREYTLSLSSDQMIDYGAMYLSALTNNIDNLNELMENTEDIENKENLKSLDLNSEEAKETISKIKTAIAGSTLEMKSVFSDDNYTSDINMNMKVKDLGEVNVTVASKSVKEKAVNIEIPTSVVNLTEKEYMELLTPTTVEATDNTVA